MKNKRSLLALLLSLVMLVATFVGCSSKTTTMKDREGNEFTAPKKIERIISTAPSNTEVLVGLGLSDKLVAVDKYSSDIDGINKDLPMIDFRNPDAETIIGLEPDIIIASGHNREGDEDPFKLIKDAGIPVVYLPSSYSIEGICGDIEFLADLTGTEKEGKKLVDTLKSEVDKIKAVGSTITDKKKVYFEIGSGSKLSSFGYDTFLNEMIEIIGAENIFGNEKSWISPSEEAVISANPDVILTNQSFLEEPIKSIATRPGWEGITAVKDNQIYLIDSNSSSRSSQNIVKALKEMAKAIYPDKYE